MTARYHFVTHWRIYGSVEEVADVIASDGPELPRWWPASFSGVEVLEAGDERGLGHAYRARVRGWLPLALNLQFTRTEVRHPERFVVEVGGDLDGRATWTLEPDGEMVNVTLDWRVTPSKPLLAKLAPLIGPVYRWNHEWIMIQGERSLALEVLRRSTPEEDREAIPEPPGPARLPVRELVAANVAAAMAAGALWLGFRRHQRGAHEAEVASP